MLRIYKKIFKTGQVIPGQYNITIAFYQKGANGKTINHDCVENVFVFEIEDTEKRMPLAWMPENWGRVVLKGIEVMEDKTH